MLQMYFATLLIGAVIMWLILGKGRSTALKNIPGPKRHFFRGHAWQFYGPKRNQQILEWAEKFGPIFKLNIFGKYHVVVTDPDRAKDILSHPNLVKFESLCVSYNEIFHVDAQGGLATSVSSDAAWKVTRTALSHAFTKEEALHSLEVSKVAAMSLGQHLLSKGDGVATDMVTECLRYSLDVLGVAQLGYNFKALGGNGQHLVLKLMKDCGKEWRARRLNPRRKYLGWLVDAWADGQRGYRVMHDFIRALLLDIRDREDVPSEYQCVWAQLARMRDPSTSQPIHQDMFLGELGGILLAGHEPVGQTLAWCLKLLANHPDCQEKLSKDLVEFGVMKGPLKALTLEALSDKLPYLDAVLREALRLFPTGCEGMARVVSKGPLHVGGGVTLDKGTVVWVHPYTMHRSKKLWGLDAESFKPERWVEDGLSSPDTVNQDAKYDGFNTLVAARKIASETDTNKSKTDKPNKDVATGDSTTKDVEPIAATSDRPCSSARDAFMPFGFGPRSCLGQKAAQATLKAALAILITYFKFEPVVEEMMPYNEAASITLELESGKLPLLITARF
ncbi:hypothetical protein CEUSTIGMA_g5807.t1 [Chlamydomonas eustigma]|uniref:Cytochrome P450 n=1 Tax=Chlamydomonas eustigma TaxID=1157962 RepID=A0A250X5L2_9CHLO|nr:hypothetical protein CEUSTIGMA_g5807.t1 [Chlamydomonas eustigma]|eukprot:GAX78365.1 hypothetical protein CEUSTIGMA_g5807.t1 [Chlamydomonas eustigma]